MESETAEFDPFGENDDRSKAATPKSAASGSGTDTDTDRKHPAMSRLAQPVRSMSQQLAEDHAKQRAEHLATQREMWEKMQLSQRDNAEMMRDQMRESASNVCLGAVGVATLCG